VGGLAKEIWLKTIRKVSKGKGQKGRKGPRVGQGSEEGCPGLGVCEQDLRNTGRSQKQRTRRKRNSKTKIGTTGNSEDPEARKKAEKRVSEQKNREQAKNDCTLVAKIGARVGKTRRVGKRVTHQGRIRRAEEKG